MIVLISLVINEFESLFVVFDFPQLHNFVVIVYCFLGHLYGRDIDDVYIRT